MTTPAPAEEPPAPAPPAGMPAWAIWSFAALAFASVLACIFMKLAENKGSDDPPEAILAEGACMEFVDQRLVAPDTAEYSNIGVRGGNGGEWIVSGQVTAQNRMAVPIRMTFRCEVRHVGGRWLLTSLTGLDG